MLGGKHEVMFKRLHNAELVRYKRDTALNWQIAASGRPSFAFDRTAL
jgi:hypothetical protein